MVAVYRIRYKGRPLVKEKKVSGESIANLIKLLEEPESRVRYRAKIELSARDTAKVLKEVDRWVEDLAKRPRSFRNRTTLSRSVVDISIPQCRQRETA